MKIQFSKYQGTGNDFIMIDNLDGCYANFDVKWIQQMCDRRFGVGADGLILIQSKVGFDFEMDYYNSDGSKSFCGNGARCAVTFAHSIGITKEEVHFWAIDGEHKAIKKNDLVYLEMKDVLSYESNSDFAEINTGSPHYIAEDNDLTYGHVFQIGKEIRYSDKYIKEGINVNLVKEISTNQIEIATYERGVEDETLSCGTGATACALNQALKHQLNGEQVVDVKVKGGDLKVSFSFNGSSFKHILLIGPAQFVFDGAFNV